ncbi:hypothetical protein [Methylomonas sp. AM2-LC]|uniref:hypothetical protein n=1 Tax=Methylomonas sp. AM2-LC TaxID=3153301 RepID=UPI003266455D
MISPRLLPALLLTSGMTMAPTQTGLTAELVPNKKNTPIVANSTPTVNIPENNKQIPKNAPHANRQMLPMGEALSNNGRHIPEMGQQAPTKRVIPMGKANVRFKATPSQ